MCDWVSERERKRKNVCKREKRRESEGEYEKTKYILKFTKNVSLFFKPDI